MGYSVGISYLRRHVLTNILTNTLTNILTNTLTNILTTNSNTPELIDESFFTPPAPLEMEDLEQDEYCGTTFPTPNGGVLTVVGWKGRNGSGNKNYVLACSICSEDTELWPLGSICSIKGNLVKGKTPCGCAKNPNYNPWQYKIVVSRLCTERCYTYKGMVSPWNKNTTKLALHNPKTGNTWCSTSINDFKRGCGDPIQGVISVRQARLIGDDIHIAQFITTGVFKDGTQFWRSTREDSQYRIQYWYYSCPACSKDEYVNAGLCSGVFEGSTGSIKKGHLSCRCSKGYRWTQEQRTYHIKKLLKEENHISFDGWVSSYKNPRSKFKWICSEGHSCTTSVASFLSQGSRCPSCATRGFNPSKPAWFYIVRWYGFGESFIKYGITNHEDYMTRIKQQDRTAKLDYEILELFRHEDGNIIFKAEQQIKALYPIPACKKEWMEDGYSETIPDTQEDLERIINIVEQLTEEVYE